MEMVCVEMNYSSCLASFRGMLSIYSLSCYDK